MKIHRPESYRLQNGCHNCLRCRATCEYEDQVSYYCVKIAIETEVNSCGICDEHTKKNSITFEEFLKAFE